MSHETTAEAIRPTQLIGLLCRGLEDLGNHYMAHKNQAGSLIAAHALGLVEALGMLQEIESNNV